MVLGYTTPRASPIKCKMSQPPTKSQNATTAEIKASRWSLYKALYPERFTADGMRSPRAPAEWPQYRNITRQQLEALITARLPVFVRTPVYVRKTPIVVRPIPRVLPPLLPEAEAEPEPEPLPLPPPPPSPELEEDRGRTDAEVFPVFVENRMKARIYYNNRPYLTAPYDDERKDGGDIINYYAYIIRFISYMYSQGVGATTPVHVSITLRILGQFSKVSISATLGTLLRAVLAERKIRPEYYASISQVPVIIKTKIILVARPAGGCNKSKKTKHTRVGNFKTDDSPSKNNDCLFVSARAIIKDCPERITANYTNSIRAKYGIEAGAKITDEQAVAILEDIRDPEWGFILTCEMSKTEYHSTKGDRKMTHIILKDDHFHLVEESPVLTCKECLKQYIGSHKCNLKMVSYKRAKLTPSYNGKSGKRRAYLLPPTRKIGLSNHDEVIHFDLETLPVETKTENGESLYLHRPYALGWCQGDKGGALTGFDCLEKFLTILGNLPKQKVEIKGKETVVPYILNAYNGARFDIYLLVNEIQKGTCGAEILQLVNQAGSLIVFEFSVRGQTFKTFDLSKHLLGTLKDNLKAIRSTVQKGDFDHSISEKAGSWEAMTPEQQNDCLVYLKADVLGLRNLYNAFNNKVYGDTGTNISEYISTSQLTFTEWNRTRGHLVELSNIEDDELIREALYGGRTYKTRDTFTSSQYTVSPEGIPEPPLPFDEYTDYMDYGDCVSLYPTAMTDRQYPVGDSFRVYPVAIDALNKMTPAGVVRAMEAVLGIYNIDFQPNKSLLHAVIPRKTKEGLMWDLADQTDRMTASVDIATMIKAGYKVQFRAPTDDRYSIIWETKGLLFDKYIKRLYQDKESAQKDTPAYTLAKLFMNGLYGKMLQRPIYTVSKVIYTNKEYWEFWGKHTVDDLTQINDLFLISGVARLEDDKRDSITKPAHLGVFILAYSRAIMYDFILQANPTQDPDQDFYYTDTDSLMMKHEHMLRIDKWGHKGLGGFTSDLKGDCKIVKAYYIAPKVYMLIYVKKGVGGYQYKETAKGISGEIGEDGFQRLADGEQVRSTRDFMFQKVHTKINSTQEGIEEHSIIHYSTSPLYGGKYEQRLTRTLNSTIWKGREKGKDSGYYFPYHYGNPDGFQGEYVNQWGTIEAENKKHREEKGKPPEPEPEAEAGVGDSPDIKGEAEAEVEDLKREAEEYEREKRISDLLNTKSEARKIWVKMQIMRHKLGKPAKETDDEIKWVFLDSLIHEVGSGNIPTIQAVENYEAKYGKF